MRKLYIPEVGDEIILASDWKFTLYPEGRNVKLGIKLGFCEKLAPFTSETWFDKPGGKDLGWHPGKWDSEKKRWDWEITYSVILEKGTKLKIDRIYIRKGNKEYSSLSFWIKSGKFKGARFWAPLKEVNEINFKLEEKPTQKTLNL